MMKNASPYRRFLAACLCAAAALCGNLAPGQEILPTPTTDPQGNLTLTYPNGNNPQSGIYNRAAFGLNTASLSLSPSGNILTITGGTRAELEYNGGPNADGTVFAFRSISTVTGLEYLNVENLTFTGGNKEITTGSAGAYGGGALFSGFALDQTITIKNSIFDSNVTIDNNTGGTAAGAYGGGLALNQGNGAKAILEDITITNNSAKMGDDIDNSAFGGGLSIADFSNIQITGGTISGNDVTASDTTYLGDPNFQNAFGGGIAIFNDTGTAAIVNISDTIISGNTAESNNRQAAGGGLWLQNKVNPSDADKFITTLTNVTFQNNTVTGDTNSGGGAVWTDSDLTVKAEGGNVLFSGNTVNGVGNSITSQANVTYNAVGAADKITDEDGFFVTGNVTKTGAGTLEIKTEVASGELSHVFGDLNIYGGTVDFVLGSVVDVGGDVNIGNGTPNSGTAVINWNGIDLDPLIGGGLGQFGGFVNLDASSPDGFGNVNVTVNGGTVRFNLDGAPVPPTVYFYIDKDIITVGDEGAIVEVTQNFQVRGKTVTGSGDITKTGLGTLLFGTTGAEAVADGFNIDGTVTIEGGTLAFGDRNGTAITNAVTYSEAGSIVIANNSATLDLGANAELVTTNGGIDVGGGTFRLGGGANTASETTVNGGKIQADGNTGTTAELGDVIVTNGVTVEVVNSGATLTNGELIEGDVNSVTITKTGNGTYKTTEVADLSNSDLIVNGGQFVFDKDVTVNDIEVNGTAGLTFNGNAIGQNLTTATGSTVTATAGHYQSFGTVDLAGTYNAGGSDLIVDSGTIAGTVTGVDNLVKFDSGNNTGDANTLAVQTDSATTFRGDIYVEGGTLELQNTTGAVPGADDYAANNIIVDTGAILDIQAGTLVHLTDNDDTRNHIGVAGTLKVNTAAGTGIYRGTDTGAGIEDTNLLVSGGTVEIYGTDGSVLWGDTLNTRVDGTGTINVGTGITFHGGTVDFAGGTGANVSKTGNGVYHAEEVDLGTGSFTVTNGGVVFDSTVVAGTLTLNFGTNATFNAPTAGIANVFTNGTSTITANADQKFGKLTLANGSNYIGNSFDMTNTALDTALTLTNGGTIAGTITGVSNFTTNGDLMIAGTGKITDSGTFTVGANSTLYIDVANHAGPNDPVDYTSIETDEFRLGNSNSNVVFNVADAARTYTNVIITNDPTFTQTNYGNKFSVITALKKQVARIENGNLSLDIYRDSVGDYVSKSWGNSGNARRIADLLDRQNNSVQQSLENLTDSQLRSVLQNSLGGEIISDATQLAVSAKPFRRVFRHLDESAPLRSPFNYFWGNQAPVPYQTRGQVREGFNLWFDVYAASENSDGDRETFDGYDASRFGMIVGGDVELYRYAIAGLVLGYGNPSIKNDIGKVTADDISFGLYFRTPLVWDIAANLYMGYGTQDYSYSNSGGKTGFNGDSLAISAEFSKELPFTYVSLTPLLAVDFQRASSDDVNVHNLPVVGGVTYDSRSIEQAIIRVGLNGKYKRLRTRLQYGHLLSGDQYAVTNTSLTGSPFLNAAVQGTNVGEDWFILGLGGELLNTHRWRIFADYDLDVGKESVSHTGNVNVVFSW